MKLRELIERLENVKPVPVPAEFVEVVARLKLGLKLGGDIDVTAEDVYLISDTIGIKIV
jgi:hypothetical protein